MTQLNNIPKDINLQEGTRTTMSLSENTLKELNHASQKTKLPIGFLAVFCLKKMMKSQDKSLNEQDTVSYNSESCPEKINVYLNTKEQMSLRAIRAQKAISVSFLMSIAVKMYLKGIVRLLMHRLVNNYYKLNLWFKVILRNLRGFHQKIHFRHHQVYGYRTILVKNRRMSSLLI